MTNKFLNNHGMAVPIVLVLVTVIFILIFSLKNTGTDYYRMSVSEIKSLRIEKFLDAFFRETVSFLNHALNEPGGTAMQAIKDEFLNLPVNSSGMDIKALLFKPVLVNMYSKSLRDLAAKYDQNLQELVDNNVEAVILNSNPIPVPKNMKTDSGEKKIVIKLSAKMTYMGITRENGIKFKLKIVRVTLPVLSSFTLFAKDSFLETSSKSGNEKGLGYNVVTAKNGLLKNSAGNNVGALILNNGNESDPVKQGKIYLGDGSGNNKIDEQIIIRLVEEKNVPATNSGNCPFSNIKECGIDTRLLQSKRAYKINTKGQIFVFLHGFGDHLKSSDIMTNYSINNFFHSSKLQDLKLECGIKNLDYTNFNQCAPLLLFGDNLNLSPAIIFGNVRRTYVRLTNYDQSMGLCYYTKKQGSAERDLLFSFRSDVTGALKTSFNAHTGVKYETVFSNVINEPYSADKNHHSSSDYSDNDTDTGFDLFKYNYADFNDSTTGDSDYLNGLSARICVEFDNEDVFKLECLNKNGSKWFLNVDAGIACINGDLDLSANGSMTSIENQNKCIVIVKGDLILPDILKKNNETTATFVSAVYKNQTSGSEGGKIKLRGNKLHASIISWLNNSQNLEFQSVPVEISGTMALNKLFLEDNFVKDKKIKLVYDKFTRGKKYFFSFLPERAEIW